MATTSTIPTVKAQMVTKFTTALATASTAGGQVQVSYAWPGPKTESESVFLGPHPETADIRLDRTSQIATIKAGRKHMDEDYTVRVTVWSFRPDLSVEAANTCEARAFALLAHIEDEFADDPRLGLGVGVVKKAEIASTASTLLPFQKGWACELAVDIEVEARLT